LSELPERNPREDDHYINIYYSGERKDDDEATLENIKNSLKNIENEVRLKKLEFFETICHTTKVFRFGDPKQILKQDILYELWKEIYLTRRYRVERRSIEEFKRVAESKVMKKFNVKIIINIPLLDLPDDHIEWARARNSRTLGGITVDSDIFE